MGDAIRVGDRRRRSQAEAESLVRDFEQSGLSRRHSQVRAALRSTRWIIIVSGMGLAEQRLAPKNCCLSI